MPLRNAWFKAFRVFNGHTESAAASPWGTVGGSSRVWWLLRVSSQCPLSRPRPLRQPGRRCPAGAHHSLKCTSRSRGGCDPHEARGAFLGGRWQGQEGHCSDPDSAGAPPHCASQGHIPSPGSSGDLGITSSSPVCEYHPGYQNPLSTPGNGSHQGALPVAVHQKWPS